VRAVLDPNVIISALLSPDGAPAKAVRMWLQGRFELIVSPRLLDELGRAFGYAKLRKRIEPEEGRRITEWLATAGTLVTDPAEAPTIRSPDPGDDYLIALAEAARAVLVSGDKHLLGLGEDLPVYSPDRFLRLLEHGPDQ
jgi:putative PIN family toxin of toxin-antitoxin system